MIERLLLKDLVVSEKILRALKTLHMTGMENLTLKDL